MPFRSITLKPNQPFTQLISSATDAGNTLIFNSDQINAVWLTDAQVGNPATVDAGPIPPNGSVVVDGSEDIYAFCLGGTPLVYLYPSGVAAFRGLTQSLGNLAIPSVQSPNFITGVSGWQIAQDGSAEFNNIKIRGNQIFSDGFISNGDGTLTTTPGLFLYDGPPAAGNLIYSIASAAGTDKFGNNYVSGGATTYNNSLQSAVNVANGMVAFYIINTPNPGATFTQMSDIIGQGATGIELDFGDDGLLIQNVHVAGASIVNVNSRGFPNCSGGDFNTYYLGQLSLNANGIAIPTTTHVQLLAIPVVQGAVYDLEVRIAYQGNQNAGNPIIGWHGGIAMPSANGWTQFGFVQNAIYNNSVPGDRTGPALTTGSMLAETKIRFVAPSTGNVSLSAACGTGGDTFTVLFANAILRPIG